MFAITKKYKILESDLFEGFEDHHSHLLPGVDDGVQRLEESLRILDWYESLGVKRVIFTPHIMEDYPSNNYEVLSEKFAQFKEEYKGSIELSLGAEYMLDSKFEEHLESGKILTLWDNYILVESSYIAAPVNFVATIKRIISKGYFVVLAHPERYLFLQREDYAQLHAMGVLFQLNLLSICGCYGEAVRKRTQELLNSSLYDILGSDIHSMKIHEDILKTSKLKNKELKQLKFVRDSRRR